MTKQKETKKTCPECGKEAVFVPWQRRCSECIELSRANYYQDHKEQILASSRNRRAANPDKEREALRKWRREHPEQYKATAQAYYQANKVKYRAYDKVWREVNHDYFKEQQAEYYIENKEHHQEIMSEWRQRSKHKMREFAAVRRELSKSIPGSFTDEEWQALKAKYDYTCLCCGKKEPEITLQVDHIIPLSKPGCTHNIDNIQPLCGSCNSRKHREVIDYRPDYKENKE